MMFDVGSGIDVFGRHRKLTTFFLDYYDRTSHFEASSAKDINNKKTTLAAMAFFKKKCIFYLCNGSKKKCLFYLCNGSTRKKY
jgi:hypothetical protein